MALARSAWQQIGETPEGFPVRVTEVVNQEQERVIGQILDLGDGSYNASWIDLEGQVRAAVLPDYFAAVIRIAHEAEVRHRRLN